MAYIVMAYEVMAEVYMVDVVSACTITVWPL